MHLQVADAGNGVLNVLLIGRLDTPGVDRIEIGRASCRERVLYRV